MIKRKDGNIEKIDAGGLGLGMLDFGLPYEGKNMTFNTGDQLFLYTDGIPEALNLNDEEYSDERMIEYFKNNSDKPVSEFNEAIVSDVKALVGVTPQSDDITCLILKRVEQ
jgi:phosphoserine phosphatase RsbU/P